MKRIILQLFQWKLKDIQEHLREIKENGYNYIQLSPLQPTKDGGLEWWKLYQPIAFTIGNPQIGTKKELIELCKEAHKYGIKVISDVVVNHVASKDDNPLEPHEKVDKNLLKPEFFKEKKIITNWEDRNEVIRLSNGLPCLDLSNHKLQDIIIDFLNELIDCGVDGFRVDSAKSIALPCEGSDFWQRVFTNLKSEVFVYAEVIFTTTKIIDEYNKYVNVTTACKATDTSKIISYVENHDSFLDDIIGYTRTLSDHQIVCEWRNLVTNYDNVLFYARPFNDTWKSSEMRYINKEIA